MHPIQGRQIKRRVAAKLTVPQVFLTLRGVAACAERGKPTILGVREDVPGNDVGAKDCAGVRVAFTKLDTRWNPSPENWRRPSDRGPLSCELNSLAPGSGGRPIIAPNE